MHTRISATTPQELEMGEKLICDTDTDKDFVFAFSAFVFKDIFWFFSA